MGPRGAPGDGLPGEKVQTDTATACASGCMTWDMLPLITTAPVAVMKSTFISYTQGDRGTPGARGKKGDKGDYGEPGSTGPMVTWHVPSCKQFIDL